jgi:hypothetical protein
VVHAGLLKDGFASVLLPVVTQTCNLLRRQRQKDQEFDASLGKVSETLSQSNQNNCQRTGYGSSGTASASVSPRIQSPVSQ